MQTEVMLMSDVKFLGKAGDIVKVAAAFFYIPDNTAQDAFIGIRLHINFDIQQFPHSGIGKEKDSFDHNDFLGLNADGAV